MTQSSRSQNWRLDRHVSAQLRGLVMDLQKIMLGIAVTVGALALVTWLGLPVALRAVGLHPHYEIPTFDLSGGRALIVATNHATLGESDNATGVFASELTVPYFAFLDAGMNVDIASPMGGVVPVEPASMRWPLATASDRRFEEDDNAMRKLERSLVVGDLDAGDYDIVFLAGGWGAAYDLGQSSDLGEFVTQANAQRTVIGGVCHGPLGLLQAKDVDGDPLVQGRKLTAVSDAQIKQLGIDFTPLHPETELRKAGALYESETAFRDMFATHVVVDGNLVTGQNQNSGAETAHRMMALVSEKLPH
jgi:putative intracellular protease/amidase